MIKYIPIMILTIMFFVFTIYLIKPNYSFPIPPSDALQSNEEADTETPLRRAYFTNFTRQEVIEHYQKVFAGIRLNYPPEEAMTIIRDQTRSTYLEELVHPFRESLYINGFEPKDPKDAIFINNKSWKQKITVKYVNSNLVIRTVVGLSALVSLYFLIKELINKV